MTIIIRHMPAIRTRCVKQQTIIKNEAMLYCKFLPRHPLYNGLGARRRLVHGATNTTQQRR